MPPRFEVYRAVSEQIRRIFAAYTLLVEPLSLDEAYLDVTENLRGIPTASATAKEIRARIVSETGLTASAGISYNKFLAKLASDHRRPNGQFVITPEMGPGFIEELLVPWHWPGNGRQDEGARYPHPTQNLRRRGLLFSARLMAATSKRARPARACYVEQPASTNGSNALSSARTKRLIQATTARTSLRRVELIARTT